MHESSRRANLLRLAAGLGTVAALTLVYVEWLHGTNATTVSLTFLMVVLVVAATARLWVAVAVSFAAMLCFNFFFLPPRGTLTIADAQNWVALFAFLLVSLVASNLSAAVRARAREAVQRRDELTRLFDLSRDVLLMTDSLQALPVLARSIARRFDLEYVAICLPREGAWDLHEAGTTALTLAPAQLAEAFAGAQQAMEFDAHTRTYAGQRTVAAGERAVRLVPLRVGVKPIGILAASGRPIEPGTLDALGGVVAIGIEHAQFLEERKEAELTRRSEQLKSALLASLGHDLRTPLTAIRIAAGNLKASWLSAEGRTEQSDLILQEAERLTTLFQNILDMARIDAGAVETDQRWVHPSEILAAAREQVAHALRERELEVDIAADEPVRVDPRLTATALARVIENAAQYAPPATPIAVSVAATAEGLAIQVCDRGPGIAPADLPHLFDRFYRGAGARPRAAGTGMGLSIARGLLAAEGGRIWAENCADGGARFSLVLPAAKAAVPEGGP